MTVNLSNGLAALSMLSNTNSYADFATPAAPESLAVRKAKAQFTLAPTTPPWKQPATKTPEASRITAIKQLSTIIDNTTTSPTAGSRDVQTAFTTYKALDKLMLLATAASRTTTTDSEHVSLQTAFAKGLSDLQQFLGQAGSDKVNLSFGLPTRRAETVPITPSDPVKFTGKGIVDARDAPLPLDGTEVFKISLDKPGASDTLTIDMSKVVLPATLDRLSSAFNDAIKAIELRKPDGSVVLDDNGNPTPRWLVRFLPDKSTGKWGLSVQAPNGAERVSIDQVGAPDALVVATGQTAVGAAPVTQMLRFNDAAGDLARDPLATIAATDTAGTARAKLTATKPKTLPGTTPPPAPGPLQAATTTQAITTDAAGNTYLVGTTAGDLQSNRSSGSEDLFLTKLDSEGAVVWQRSLGAPAGAKGAAIAVAANGDVTVAGTVTGMLDGQSTDGDMVVARYAANGDEKFATVLQSAGPDSANALALGADGSVFVGGKAATGGGDAFVARLDASGKVQQRRTIDGGGSDSVTALAVDGDGNLLALINSNGVAQLRRLSSDALGTELGSLSLGQADARALAVAPDGQIAVAGATSKALNGAQANSRSDGRDGFVTRINSALGNATTTYIATPADDQVDSVAFMNGAIYAGGRTAGAIEGNRIGSVDGFVARLDAASGGIQDVTQFGQQAMSSEPVRVAASAGGDTVLGALGLHRGALNPETSIKLVAQTSLRPGDEFSLRVQGGTVQKVVIGADDTLATLADRIRKLTGSKAVVATATVSGATVLRIDAKAGSSVELIEGPDGKDALAKLGLDPMRLSVPAVTVGKGPTVRPGGTFGLALTESLNVSTAKDAAATLAVLKSAISTTQTAYRSLYWDAGKANLVNGASGATTAMTPAQQAQLASYKSALARLTPTADTSTSTSLLFAGA